MAILVTGGLGYIGSNLCVDLLNENHEVVILDNLSRSDISILDDIETLTNKTPSFYEACVSDIYFLNKILQNHDITHVIYLAGYKSVKESSRYPELYFDNNVNHAISFFEYMVENGVKNYIFSSSATVYGETDQILTETSELKPNSTYGSTKLMVEIILEKIQSQNPDINVAILRYFNPIGQHSSGLLQDKGDDNLYPNIKKCLENNTELSIYGNDYNTPDGTCIRDYIQINDLNKYHKLFLNFNQGYDVFNVGTGIGKSVLQVVQEFPPLRYRIEPRRKGDNSVLVCSTQKLKDYLCSTK